MSSVTRFLRQIPVSTTYYSLPDSSASLYVFDPDSNNYVGNYPPGLMKIAPEIPAVKAWMTAYGIYDQSGNAVRSKFILRDMGKTFRAPMVAGQQEQFYRQVQILEPGPFPVPCPALSKTDGASGVIGGSMVPTMDSKYATFYIPVAIGGLTMSAPGVYPIAGGQM